ncbi:hypothetical protein FHETE_9085 [Fusarium heterosporum]|uniref:Uncharacterized protein n=1 Tax=Fusarium heterosporum TaxID=42747 RepID=A0A8H5SU93_FUSHE|nr:hypothetical protein FHETE_9085 [Fusarium heterosporum]
MRFSFQTIALSLLSTQLPMAFAGPCKPSGTTSIGSTTTAPSDASTTMFSEVVTTTAEATTTTIAAETTTTTMSPEITPLLMVFKDGRDNLGGYMPSDGFVGSSSEGAIAAVFALEPETSRLYATRPDGSKLYCMTVIPDGSNYGLIFNTAEAIENVNVYHFVTCAEAADGFLDCQSESGPTPIVYYYAESNMKYYGNSDPDFDSDPVVRFKIQ